MFSSDSTTGALPQIPGLYRLKGVVGAGPGASPVLPGVWLLVSGLWEKALAGFDSLS